VAVGESGDLAGDERVLPVGKQFAVAAWPKLPPRPKAVGVSSAVSDMWCCSRRLAEREMRTPSLAYVNGRLGVRYGAGIAPTSPPLRGGEVALVVIREITRRRPTAPNERKFTKLVEMAICMIARRACDWEVRLLPMVLWL
jgi:hypothetical protein